ncbi:hypothetical protein [Sulfitobacter sediminilitoris]|uniref:hypothetical protein n=1 Tax=Sulfitobacter sediminilitoris TaxID=2698830 RepID=UPI003622F038
MKIEFRAIEGYAYGAIQPSVILRFPKGDAGLAVRVASLARLLDFSRLSSTPILSVQRRRRSRT